MDDSVQWNEQPWIGQPVTHYQNRIVAPWFGQHGVGCSSSTGLRAWYVLLANCTLFHQLFYVFSHSLSVEHISRPLKYPQSPLVSSPRWGMKLLWSKECMLIFLETLLSLFPPSRLTVPPYLGSQAYSPFFLIWYTYLTGLSLCVNWILLQQGKWLYLEIFYRLYLQRFWLVTFFFLAIITILISTFLNGGWLDIYPFLCTDFYTLGFVNLST